MWFIVKTMADELRLLEATDIADSSKPLECRRVSQVISKNLVLKLLTFNFIF